MALGRVPASPRQASRLVAGAPRTSATAAAFFLAVLLLLTGCSANVKAGELHGQVLDPPFTVSTQDLVDTDG
ncbi:MAG TPA: hypothetical protein VFI19_00855, partial [Nocardioides sp.]|nr:hypothetical protein [Nocardioides sp.]